MLAAVEARVLQPVVARSLYAILRRSHKARLDPEKTLEHCARVRKDKPDPHSHDQRDHPQPALFVRIAIQDRSAVEADHGESRKEHQRQVEQEHVKEPLVEPHNQDGDVKQR